MRLTDAGLPGLWIVEPAVHEDDRGFFQECYSKRQLETRGISIDFVQENHLLSVSPGTLRGLHYQTGEAAQTKLVRVLAGSIYDVAVDIRPDSPTFGRWIGLTLSAADKRQLLVPRGFAHGIYTLESNTEVAYKVDRYYSPSHDRGIMWDDPELNIAWPGSRPILSDKDARQPSLQEAMHLEREVEAG